MIRLLGESSIDDGPLGVKRKGAVAQIICFISEQNGSHAF